MSDSQILHRVRELAKHHGIGARRLSAGSGVSQSTCYYVLRGESDTSTERAEAMLHFLESFKSCGESKKSA